MISAEGIDNSKATLQAGTRVRLRRDPNRIGVLAERTRDQGRIRKRQVVFPDGTQYVPEDQLERVPEGVEDPIDLLESGRLGDALDLRRTLTHERLTGRLADVIYSMDTTGTDFYAHQFKPVIKLLNSAGRGILIADEVGLGKTIEAGLIWTELRSRFDFRRLLVLCPAVLREKWRRELRNRFGVEAEIHDAAGVLSKLREAADAGHTASFAIVGSLQGLRPRRGWNEAEYDREGGAASHLARYLDGRAQEDPLIDLCVVDEAHYLRNPETMTASLGRVVRGVADYMVLLSATPVHLKSGDLFQLLNLLDEDTFQREQSFDEILEANRPLIRARDLVVHGQATANQVRENLQEAAENPLLSGSRQITSLLEEVPGDAQLADPAVRSNLAHRLERVNLTGHVVTRTRKREVNEWRVIREPIAEEIEPNELERSFYETVTQVVREYCMERDAHEGFLLVTPQRQMSSSMPAALRFWQQADVFDENELWEDLGIGDENEEDRPLLRELMARAQELGDLDLLWRHDSKYERLRTRLKAHFAENPNEKIVLFSYFRATLAYLHERLGSDGIDAMVMHGGTENKDQVVSEFERTDNGMVLLSSEVGSEGIDLQFSKIVINYDLPWNPMRVEQRIGRLDRLGQESPLIHIWNLFYAETIDSRIYRRLFDRLRIFEGALGALEPVLGERIQVLTRSLFRGQLTAEQEDEQIDQTKLALENVRKNEEELEAEATHLVAYGDYILNQVNAAREMKRTIVASDIRTYVVEFFTLHYPGCDFMQVSDDPNEYEISLSPEAKHDLSTYLRRERLDGKTHLTRNDIQRLAARFENTAVATTAARKEILSQFHPLVRFVGHRIDELEEQRRPAVAIRVLQSDLESLIPAGTYAFAVQKWSVQGLRDMERLNYSTALLGDPPGSQDADFSERLVASAATLGKDWPSANLQLERLGFSLADVAAITATVCVGESDRAFEVYVGGLEAENQDRADLQRRTLERHAANQRSKLEEVRAKHEQHGRQALVKATEGRMRSLETRVERRLLEIEERRQLRHRSEDVCAGIIQVTAD